MHTEQNTVLAVYCIYSYILRRRALERVQYSMALTHLVRSPTPYKPLTTNTKQNTEMTKNLMTLRFSNAIFEPLWNRNYISNIQITFKENFGTKGRGGYFDQYGIIRDVIQNHLLQVLSIVAMEPPVAVTGENYSNHVRNEKVKVLESIAPVDLDECVLGQYLAPEDGNEPAYRDDPTVPDDSVTPTFAAMVLHVNNPRWDGVPFILKAGKALNERKAEIRVQFRQPPGASTMFAGETIGPNEFVMRLQPDEAVYMKVNVKEPGLRTKPVTSDLDLVRLLVSICLSQ